MQRDPRCAGGRVPVNKIIPFSSVDGPGNRTAVFLQGCNFNCRYCHNPETRALCISCGACVAGCPAGALRMEQGLVQYDPASCVGCDRCIHTCTHDASPRIRYMTPAEVYQEIRKNVPFIRGVTVSGGECTFYPEFIHALAVLVKGDGLGFLLDSNGTYDFTADPAELLPVIDGVMLDVKAYDAAEHQRVTDEDNALVLRNMHFLAARGQLYEVRTVVVPGLFDAEGTVREVARALRPYLSVPKHWPAKEGESIRYKIIKYRPFGVRDEYRGFEPPTDELLLQLSAAARAEGMTDIIII